ncbi:hypothetical protein LP52_06950 [Streptomonospora alba]|uniref:Uncharacterized protein n=1 Tax=Streptomonospora alba TaxID=183763 RepID=A0A0C2JRZ6_9ACTN|nr:hypothetical protein [Streptomonospora alba]KIH99597.1 hypothetical protein LP52_06950 [Streptomonospora alba]
MTTLRSARLEALIGNGVAEATYANVLFLVTNNVPENFDLDYKRDLYERTDAGKRECAPTSLRWPTRPEESSSLVSTRTTTPVLQKLRAYRSATRRPAGSPRYSEIEALEFGQ